MNETTSHPSKEETLSLKDFDYELPDHLIAQQPEDQRDHSRLLLRHTDGSRIDRHFEDLPDILPENSVLVVNNSKVFASRLIGKLKTGGKVEIFLLSKPKMGAFAECEALGKPMKKLKVGAEIFFTDDVIATVMKKPDGDFVSPLIIEFNISGDQLLSWCDQHGYVPLPPYIQRKEAKPVSQSEDADSYQTVYAENTGSVAAPTAGLHFTDALIKKLEQKNISFVPVTLHVGAGTFMPVKHEDIDQHVMHKEWHFIPRSTMKEIVKAKKDGRKVIAVGTTSLRTLESVYRMSQQQNKDLSSLADEWNETDLFLRPKTKDDIYNPWIIDGIITNFHQPCSTLFMLISHLIGFEEAHRHYKHAVDQEYRFFSYGDSNLLWL